MQPRWPFPNGFQACGGILSRMSGAKRSGSNRSGSFHTAGSRCRAGSSQQHVALLDRVAAREQRVVFGRDREPRGGRPQAQRLAQDLIEVAELRHLLEPRGIGAEHAICLGLSLAEDFGMLEQEMDREAEQSAGRLVAGDQEREQLIADIGVVEMLPGHRVLGVEHEAQEIPRRLVFRHLAALGDQLLGDRVHETPVRLVLALCSQHQRGLNRQTPRPAAGFRQCPHHGFDERMHLVLIKRVEAVAEAGQRDGVEREPGHVVGDVDRRFRAEPLPLRQHLVGDIEHVLEIIPHRRRTEGRHQDAVRLGPVGLVGMGGEQAVGDEIPQVGQPTADLLVETSLVTGVGSQLERAEHQHGALAERQAIDGPELAGELDHALDRRFRIDVRGVPYERAHAGLRNVGFEGSTHRERLSSDLEIG